MWGGGGWGGERLMTLSLDVEGSEGIKYVDVLVPSPSPRYSQVKV